jgi:TonB-dependent Receptor Plug Domain
VVQDGTAGRGLPDVQITGDDRFAALTDSAGGYRLTGLSAGPHQLRFVREGYDTLDLGVLVAESSVSRIDVDLVPRPVRLRTLQVTALSQRPQAARSDEAELGRTRLDDDWLARRQAGDGDPLRALADAPGVQAGREGTAALHVRGGGGADNLVLLDGIPLYSAVHFGGASSAINPDLLAGADLHAGVTPARYGEHLAGVLELETRDAGPDPFAARGAFDRMDVRQGFSGYVPALGTGLALAARTTYRSSLANESYGAESLDGSGYGDLLGVATGTLGGGRLRLLSFYSGNRLAFPSVDDYGDGYGDETGEGVPFLHNDIRWNSWSEGATWRATAGGLQLQTAAWAAGSSAQIAWGGAEGPEQLRSTLAEVGLSARAAWPGDDGGTSVGFSLVRPDARYSVSGAGGLSLSAAPLVGSVFAERQWRPAAGLLVSAGLRAGSDFARWAGLEPRLSVVAEPDTRTRIGVGAGRSHQVLQSVVNDASPLGLVLGAELPVAAGAGGLPVARADQLEAFAGRRLAAGLDLSLSAYVRRSEGIVLGALSTRDFFPGDSLVVGRGEARGVSGALELARGPVNARASVTLASNVRAAGSTRYNAGYGHGTTLGLDASYRMQRDTRLLLRFRGGAHDPSSVAEAGFDWEPGAQSGELAGTPVILPGAVNAQRLPAYARLDLGFRRDWHLPAVGRGTVLTTGIAVANALDQGNVLGLVATEQGGIQALQGLPRTLEVEVGWRF